MTTSIKPQQKGRLPTNEQSSFVEPKKYVSSDDLYRHSSQYQVWSFNAPQLAEMRHAANEKGKAAAIKRFEAARSTSAAENAAVYEKHGAELSADNLLKLISPEEEQIFLRFICQQIVQICAHFNMPTQVRATAISFFRKFYLIHSVMEYRPKNIAYTIVFLAAKLENYFISIESFCTRIPKTKPADILDLEFIVLQTLQFTLLVHHPFRPLWGFFLDFQAVLLHPNPVMYDVSVDTLGRLYDSAKAWLNDHALVSDAAFLFTPPQIALAAMYDCDRRITEKYLMLKFPKEVNGDVKEEAKEEVKTEAKRGVKKEEDGGVKQEEDGGVKQEEEGEVRKGEVKGETESGVDLLIKTIKKCVFIAKQDVATSREESAKIDERCFFILSPQKLLKKKVKTFSE